MGLPTDTLDLDQFDFLSATFEARSTPNYLQWDRSGLLWSQFLEKRPEAELSQAQPDASSFRLENRYSFAVALKLSPGVDPHTSMSTTDEKPNSSLSGFVECVEDLLAVATQTLEIDEFIRVGLRLMFVKEYPDLKSANSALLKTKLLQYPTGPHFGVEGEPTHPSYVLKWENDRKGAMVHLTSETRKIEFNPPAEWRGIEGFKREVHRLLYDFDYYTSATVGLSQLRATDWIKTALHLARRDSGKFLGGV